MEDLLYDYFVSQGMASIPGHDQSDSMEYRRDLYFNAVLKKHGLSRADFDSSMVYYYTRADRFVKIFKNVQDRLSDDALSLGASEGEVERFTTQSLSGDTANVWEGDRSTMLVPYAPYNRLQFYQKADTSYRKGDSFMLAFKSDFLYQGGTKDALAYLAVKYTNDSIVSQVVHFSTSGITQLRIHECDDKAKELSGYFYLGEGMDKSPNLKMLFLSNVQLIRFHKKQQDANDKEEAKPEQQAPAPDIQPQMVPDSLRPRPHRLGERPLPQPERTMMPQAR